MRRFLPFLAVLAAACGSTVTVPEAVTTTASPLSYGKVYARATIESYELGAELTKAKTPEDPCAGATVTAGACCFVPSQPTASPSPMQPAGATSDGSPIRTDESAGTITWTDAAATLGSSDYGPMPAGFGYAEGYPVQASITSLPDAKTWASGDAIVIRADGADGHLPGFKGTVKAVSLPPEINPSTINRFVDIDLAWSADPNATTMEFLVASSVGSISCRVADSAEHMTVPREVLEHLQANTNASGWIERSATSYVELGGGHVSLVAAGTIRFGATVQ